MSWELFFSITFLIDNCVVDQTFNNSPYRDLFNIVLKIMI